MITKRGWYFWLETQLRLSEPLFILDTDLASGGCVLFEDSAEGVCFRKWMGVFFFSRFCWKCLVRWSQDHWVLDCAVDTLRDQCLDWDLLDFETYRSLGQTFSLCQSGSRYIPDMLYALSS